MKTELIIVENDSDLTEAMSMVEALMDSTDAADLVRLRAQARLVEDYERRRWPHRPPSVPELLRYLMEQHSLTRADLVPLLGGTARVSEVLSGKTGLSMTMVRRLRDRFGISADLLIPGGQPRAAA